MLKYGTGRGFMKVSSRAGSRGGRGPVPQAPHKGAPTSGRWWGGPDKNE